MTLTGARLDREATRGRVPSMERRQERENDKQGRMQGQHHQTESVTTSSMVTKLFLAEPQPKPECQFGYPN